MRELLRRVAVLEQLISGRPEQDESIIERAVDKLSLKEMELLLLASAADREGRGLTEPELAAKQAYQLRCERSVSRPGGVRRGVSRTHSCSIGS